MGRHEDRADRQEGTARVHVPDSRSPVAPHAGIAAGATAGAGLLGAAGLLLDADFTVVGWTGAAARLFGHLDTPLRGRRLDTLLDLPGARTLPEPDARPCGTGVEPADLGGWHGEVWLRGADGREVEARLRVEPLSGSAADPAGAPCYLATVTPHEPPTRVRDSRAARHHTEPHGMARRIGASLDLTRTARASVESAVALLADVAGVYVLEHLVEEDAAAPESGERLEVRRLALAAAADLFADAAPDPTAAVTDLRITDLADVFPPDEVLVFGPASPATRCIATGVPVLLDGIDPARADAVRREGAAPSVRQLLTSGYLLLPLTTRETVLGMLLLGRVGPRRHFDEAELALAEELAAHAAVSVDNARLYRRERHTALALQESLLPRASIRPPGLDLAHRSHAAGPYQLVGGDWFDVVAEPDGRHVGLVIGDAMGHGPAAAAAMVQLRTAMRAYAHLGLAPAEILGHLDRIASEVTEAQFATCLYVRWDLRTGDAEFARAGHIPPVAVFPDGTAGVLDVPPGLPLGVAGAGFEPHRVTLPPGTTLALCTDGLVEHHDRDVDSGLAALVAGLRTAPTDLDAACDALMRDLSQAGRKDRHHDDITLLLARIPNPAA